MSVLRSGPTYIHTLLRNLGDNFIVLTQTEWSPRLDSKSIDCMFYQQAQTVIIL